MVYFDSNLLLRVYAQMPDSEQALERFSRLRRSSPATTPITWLHELELGNAFEQLVFLARKGHAVRMTPEQAAVPLAQFDEDLAASRGLAGASLEIAEVVRAGRELSACHTARHGFRACDIIHVASALLLECDSFWSFDTKANQLAELEGLKTL